VNERAAKRSLAFGRVVAQAFSESVFEERGGELKISNAGKHLHIPVIFKRNQCAISRE
jgi:hypothetical protein